MIGRIIYCTASCIHTYVYTIIGSDCTVVQTMLAMCTDCKFIRCMVARFMHVISVMYRDVSTCIGQW